jgi:hypothetical protein
MIKEISNCGDKNKLKPDIWICVTSVEFFTFLSNLCLNLKFRLRSVCILFCATSICCNIRATSIYDWNIFQCENKRKGKDWLEAYKK